MWCPSKKSLKKARDAIRGKTGSKECFKTDTRSREGSNAFRRGWSSYFDLGYPRKAFRHLSHYTRPQRVTHRHRLFPQTKFASQPALGNGPPL